MEFTYYLDQTLQKNLRKNLSEQEILTLDKEIREGKLPKQHLNKKETAIYIGFRIRVRKETFENEYNKQVPKTQYYKVKTNERVKPECWDQTKQRVRNHMLASEMNTNLENLKVDIKKRMHNAGLKGVLLNAESVKEIIRDAVEGREPAPNTVEFFVAYEMFLQAKKPFFKPNNVKKYITTRGILQAFQKEHGKIRFETITMDFLDNLYAYFISRGLRNNTSAKYLVNLKSILKWALDKGYYNNPQVLNYKIQNDDTDFIYLTKDEFMKIYNMDLSSDATLAQVRDVFVWGCLTGQRFSDIRTLHWGSIIENSGNYEWHVYQHKGNKSRKVIVPLPSKAVEILHRYPNKFAEHNDKVEASKMVMSTVLPVRCDQVMNRHLKTLGQLAGLNDIITKVSYSGKRRIETHHKKYELLTTHCGRRTFVSLGLELGLRPEILMSVTGHNDPRMLRRYTAVSEQAKAQEIRKAWDL